MECEDETTLLRFAQARLSQHDRARVERHLDQCEACRRAVALGAAVDSQVEAHSVAAVTGNTFDRYTMLERLGTGATGSVYSAYDPQLNRKVALKVLAVHEVNNGELAKRTLNEARALAQVTHPNVVHVYDVGFNDDLFFIAMELVAGTTVRRWLQEPRPWREVLDVFVAAGRGLEAVHSAGLVYRDFKPDNVLIGDEGRVRVADFGLAQAVTTAAPLTAAAGPDGRRGTALSGTAGYIAPEVYDGSPATKLSDQFSFCVATYEALFKSLPFEGETLAELAQAAAEGRFRSPAEPGGAPAWVAHLLRRGLSSRPEARFSELSLLLDKLEKGPRTRRRVSAVASVVVVAASVFALRAHHLRTVCVGLEREIAAEWGAPGRERAALAFAALGTPQAQHTWGLAEPQLAHYVERWVDARTQVCVAAEIEGTQTKEQERLRVGCLARRRDELRALMAAFGSADNAVAEQAIAAIAQLSSPVACVGPTGLKANDPADSGAEFYRQVTALRTMAITGKAAAALPQAEALLARAQQLAQPVLVAETAELTGDILSVLSRRECLERWQEGVRAAAQAGDDERLLSQLASVITELGIRRGATSQARALYPMAEGVADRLGGGPLLARLFEAQANVEAQDGRHDAALALYRRSLDSLERDGLGAALDAARLHMECWWMLGWLGQWADAKTELERSVALYERLVTPDHPFMADVLNAQGQLFDLRGELGEEAKVLRRGIALIEQRYGPRSRRLAPMFLNLAVVLARLGEPREANALLDQLSTLGELSHESRVASFSARSAVAFESGQPEAALRFAEQAVDEERHADPPPTTISTWLAGDLARAQLGVGRPNDALATLRRAGVTGDAHLDKPNLERGDLLSLWGKAQLAAGHAPEARDALVAALGAYDLIAGIDPLKLGETKLELAEAEWRCGACAVGRAAAAEARLLYARSARPDRASEVDRWTSRRGGAAGTMNERCHP